MTDADHWSRVAQSEAARADVADAARRHAEDHARVCDVRVAAAEHLEETARRDLLEARRTIKRLRAGELAAAVTSATTCARVAYGQHSHTVSIAYDGRVWRARNVVDGAEQPDMGRGVDLVEAVEELAVRTERAGRRWAKVADADDARERAR